MYKKTDKEKLRFLNRYRCARQRSEILLAEAESIAAELDLIKADIFQKVLPKSPTVSDLPKGHDQNDKMADMAAELERVEKRYKIKLEALSEQLTMQQDIMTEVSRTIERVADLEYRKILTFRFIRLLTWGETAAKCRYSPNTLKRYKKADAVNSITIPKR